MMNKKDTKIKVKEKTEQVQISPYACAPCCEGMNTCNFEPIQPKPLPRTRRASLCYIVNLILLNMNLQAKTLYQYFHNCFRAVAVQHPGELDTTFCSSESIVEAVNPLAPRAFFKFLHTLYLKCE
jgi:hypothetical protein